MFSIKAASDARASVAVQVDDATIEDGVSTDLRIVLDSDSIFLA